MGKAMAPPGRTRRRGRRNCRVAPNARRSRALYTQVMRALVVVSAAGSATWGGLTLTDPAIFPIRQVRVEGDLKHLAPQQVQQIANGGIRGGFFALDVDRLRKSFTRHPWVRDASVRRLWPAALQITVYEQRAAARWGDAALVNKQGELFTPKKSSYPKGLVRLRGPEGTPALLLKRMRQIQTQLAPTGKRLEWLELSDRRAWSFAVIGGPTVILGRDDFDLRLRRYAANLHRALDPTGEVELLDMRYPNGFAVRMRRPQNEHS